MTIKLKQIFFALARIARLAARAKIARPVATSANEGDGVVHRQSFHVQESATVSAAPTKVLHPSAERTCRASTGSSSASRVRRASPSLEELRDFLSAFLMILGYMLFVLLIPVAISLYAFVPMFFLISTNEFAVPFSVLLPPSAVPFQMGMREFPVMLSACRAAWLWIHPSIFALFGIYEIAVALSVFCYVSLHLLRILLHPLLNCREHSFFMLCVVFFKSHFAGTRTPEERSSNLNGKRIPALAGHTWSIPA